MQLSFTEDPFSLLEDPADLDGPAEKRALVALSLVPGIGGGRVRALLAQFGAPSAVWRAPRSALTRVPGIGEQTAEAILTFDAGAAVDRQLEAAERVGAELVPPWDARYPRRLRQIYDPPATLWMQGTLQPGDEQSLAVVGTRSCTDYGRAQAREFAQAFAQRGLTVVSGLAYGIDAAAHRATLEAGGRTLAVLGSGLARVYPQRHAALARAIREQGAVLSEFPLDAKPDASNFPERNRIVSGMTLGTLVVESKSEGGALITARLACEQNREVFAVPGDAGRAASTGTNQLIQRGHAKLVLTPDDVLAELPLADATDSGATSANRSAERDAEIAALDGPARTLYDALSTTPIHLDALCDRTGVPPSAALSALLELEMRGLIRQLAGKQFRRT
jgi:DNA processing protein